MDDVATILNEDLTTWQGRAQALLRRTERNVQRVSRFHRQFQFHLTAMSTLHAETAHSLVETASCLAEMHEQMREALEAPAAAPLAGLAAPASAATASAQLPASSAATAATAAAAAAAAAAAKGATATAAKTTAAQAVTAAMPMPGIVARPLAQRQQGAVQLHCRDDVDDEDEDEEDEEDEDDEDDDGEEGSADRGGGNAIRSRTSFASASRHPTLGTLQPR